MIPFGFPTMVFVFIGFQHIVANMFIIPAAIFVSLIYFVAYKKDDSKHKGILVEKDKVKTG
jgi:formate/nitrite transporter FocA (FNT family)